MYSGKLGIKREWNCMCVNWSRSLSPLSFKLMFSQSFLTPFQIVGLDLHYVFFFNFLGVFANTVCKDIMY